MPPRLILAPLRGVTVRAWRGAYARWFAPFDDALAPFIPTVAGTRIKPALLADIAPGPDNQPFPLTPQVIGKDPAQLRALLRAFKSMGYIYADLNAGCPFPFIVAKGRGSGLLRTPDTLAALLEAGCDELGDGRFSLKVRLGVTEPTRLLACMDIINAFPLRAVTIHPRTAKQMYGGTVDLDRFDEARARCVHPVIYNGDIQTSIQFEQLQTRFPDISMWMIGRGAVANPFLVEEIRARNNTPYTFAASRADRFHAFLDDCFVQANAELSGPTSILGRMKELWSYLRVSIKDGTAVWNTIKICRTLDEYRRATENVRLA